MKTANRLLAHIHRHSLWGVACVALSILLLTSTAFAAQPLTGTFKGKVIGRFVNFTNLNNRVVTDWAGVLGLQLDRDAPGDGLGPLVPVFCIEVNVLVRSGDRYISDGPVTALHGGCQIRYLLDKYPASTATTADEAAARQLAIWHFSDDIDLTTVQEAAIGARAIVLADEAALAVALGGCPSSQTSVAGLTLDPPTANVSTGQVVNYTVTVDPASAAQSVDIIISGSATLPNGLQQATLPLVQGVATFSVVNPIAGSSTITARLPYVLDAGTVFSPINGSRPTQRLVMGDRISLIANATVQATWAQATATPIGGIPTATPSTGGSPTATPFTGDTPTATPFTGDTPTSTPFTGDTPTATPFMGGSPTATPFTAGTPTATPFAGGSPTAAPRTPVPPGDAPPVTPTRKPSNGTHSSPTPAAQSTPEGTPSNGATSPPDSGTGSPGPGTPTPSGVTGSDVPGDTGAAGGPGSGASSGGGTNGAGQIRPSQLPNTGDSSSAAPGVISVALLLIVCGVWLRIFRKRPA
jgi:LPXTG-motif cell wall-anchored protein